MRRGCDVPVHVQIFYENGNLVRRDGRVVVWWLVVECERGG